MQGYDQTRTPHYLTVNTRTTVPRHLVFVDTETKPEPHPTIAGGEQHHFRLGVAFYGQLRRGKYHRQSVRSITSTADWWRWLYALCPRQATTYVFAHNLGFDATILGLWAEIDSGRLRLADDDWPLRGFNPKRPDGKRPWRGMLIAQDPPTVIEVRHDDKTICLIDTLNYWRTSLAKLGESVGLPKLPMPDWETDAAVWWQYCDRDVAIIEAAISQLALFWQENDLGTWRATAAGLAWNAYRHRFMPRLATSAAPDPASGTASNRSTPKGVILIHGHNEALQTERDAYYGGECRCFYVGKVWANANEHFDDPDKRPPGNYVPQIGPVYVLDVTSLYPWCMKEYTYPCKLVEQYPPETTDVEELKWMAPTSVAEVLISSDTDTYPVRDGQKVRYYTGRYWTTLAGPELAVASERGHVAAVGNVFLYRTCDLFSSYVDYFWELKDRYTQEGNDVAAGLAKQLLNSLSGKFAQRQHTWEDKATSDPQHYWDRWWNGKDEKGIPILYRSIGWHSQRHWKQGEGPDSFPAVAAWITAHARNRMRYLREVAGQVNVYYQDTDSLHVGTAGLNRLQQAGLIEPNKLGSLRLVETVSCAEYFGLKHYRLGNKEVIGSVGHGAVKRSESEYSYVEFQRLPSILASRPNGTIAAWQQVKTVSLSHPDGTVGPDGWVQPIRLPST